MKALSIKNPYAQLIVRGLKPLETRKRPTSYRGDILICVSKKSVEWYDVYNILNMSLSASLADLYTNEGNAIGIATITNCRPMVKEDESLSWVKFNPNLYVYELSNIRPIKPFDVSGKLGFYEVELPKYSTLL